LPLNCKTGMTLSAWLQLELSAVVAFPTLNYYSKAH